MINSTRISRQNGLVAALLTIASLSLLNCQSEKISQYRLIGCYG